MREIELTEDQVRELPVVDWIIQVDTRDELGRPLDVRIILNTGRPIAIKKVSPDSGRVIIVLPN